jgi:1,4-dihydroxy-2-naphthoyl-CoA synthase
MAKSRLRSSALLPQMVTRHQQASKAMTDDSVIRERRGQAFWITINRPDKRNALNGEVIGGIAKGYREAHDDKDVRVIVLTGAGDKAFYVYPSHPCHPCSILFIK